MVLATPSKLLTVYDVCLNQQGSKVLRIEGAQGINSELLLFQSSVQSVYS